MNKFSPMRSRRNHISYNSEMPINDWHDPVPVQRDWKKALLILGLGTLSWVATYVGMLELIQSNMGELQWTHKIIIGFSVAMLMIMIIWLLDQLFAPLPFLTKTAYVIGYIFLTLISVGFGFGFYWKVLESRSEATRSAESAVTQVKTALYSASARLDQLQTTLDQLMQMSAAKALEERERGTTCPNSRPGDGPRRRLRDADAARFAFAAQFVKGRAVQSKGQIQTLDVEIKKITSADPSTFDPKTGTRNKFLQQLARRLQLTATGFNAFRTDPQLRQIRSELAERAAKTQFPNSRGGTFSCPDPQLQSALRGVVRAIDQLPELGKPEIATVEGAQAVVEAFRRLATTFYGVLTFKLQPSSDELRAMQQRAVQSAKLGAADLQASIQVGQGGLSKRDYIPLAIAMFVDLCLLLVSIGRPMNRLNGLIPKMREAERGPVYQILSRFDDIHRDDEVLQKFEVFRHVVFDFHGDYYVAVPLDAPKSAVSEEQFTALQQEAHLLGNLFASFEKEKIFSRVYNPMLTRSVIRKKLERQGSKFSDSQAFRIYRFRDGAWSEIILGAIMGAARERPPKPKIAAPPVALEEQVERIFAPTPQAGLQQPSVTESQRPLMAPLDGTQRNPDSPNFNEPPSEVDLQKTEQQFGPYAHHWLNSQGLNGTHQHMPAQPEAASFSDMQSEQPRDTRPILRSDFANTAADNRASMNEMQEPLQNTFPEESELQQHFEQSQARTTFDTAQEEEQNGGPREEEPSLTQDHMFADTALSSLPLSSLVPDADDTTLQPVPETEARSNYNVRITERTADFTLPVNEVPLPEQILDISGDFIGDTPHDASNVNRPEQLSPRIENDVEIEMERLDYDQAPSRLFNVNQQTDKAELDEAQAVDKELKELVYRFAQAQEPAE